MKNAKQSEMPGCKPLAMKFKDVPTVNANGTPLGFCEKCQGSGEVCTATKSSINKLGASVTETLPEFAGTLRRQRQGARGTQGLLVDEQAAGRAGTT